MKINDVRRKEKKSMAVSMKSMLNMPLGSSLRDIPTLYKGVEKVLASLRICRHAFAFHARKCVKIKYRNPCTGPRTHTHIFADWK